jgi:hypothetical protein
MDRQQQVQEVVNTHVCEIAHFDDVFEGNRPVAYKCLAGMVRRGQIRHTGFLHVGKKGGRPKRWWTNRVVPEHLRPHELKVTSAVLALNFPCKRLDDVDQDLRPDFEIKVAGKDLYGELDLSSERGTKIEDRLNIYLPVGNPVLWIVPSEARRRSLRHKDQNRKSYFALFDDVVTNPTGPIWLGRSNQFFTLCDQGIIPRKGDVTAMRKTQQQVIDGLRNGFEPQAEQPLVHVPQQGQRQPGVVVVQQPPNMPAMTRADYALARAQMVFNYLPMIMPNPNRYIDQVLEQMDDYTNEIQYEDHFDIRIR